MIAGCQRQPANLADTFLTTVNFLEDHFTEDDPAFVDVIGKHARVLDVDFVAVVRPGENVATPGADFRFHPTAHHAQLHSSRAAGQWSTCLDCVLDQSPLMSIVHADKRFDVNVARIRFDLLV